MEASNYLQISHSHLDLATSFGQEARVSLILHMSSVGRSFELERAFAEPRRMLVFQSTDDCGGLIHSWVIVGFIGCDGRMR